MTGGPAHGTAAAWPRQANTLRLFLGGDVMTGRAIDQLFAVHNDDDFGKPEHVPARRYLALSAALHGGEMRPVRHDYVWGSALGVLDQAQPDFRLVNLETAITTSNAWEKKQFSFRMHPANVPCLTSAGIDCCALANNHVLDFGVDGLLETVRTLQAAGIGHAGAGIDAAAAAAPHVHPLRDGRRILVFSWAFRDSHVRFDHWAAGDGRPGINFLPDCNEAAARRMRASIEAHRREGDVTIASLHWGANWVRSIPEAHRALARFLVDEAGVDVIHGHSSHHVLPVEIYRGKPIFYGCGDLINDYEGNPKHRPLRGHLGALYFIDLDIETRRLQAIRARPVQRRRFRLEMPSREDAQWVLAQIRGQAAAAP